MAPVSMPHNKPDNCSEKEMIQDSRPQGVVTDAAWNTFGSSRSVAGLFKPIPMKTFLGQAYCRSVTIPKD
jgi:hypothetical protein